MGPGARAALGVPAPDRTRQESRILGAGRRVPGVGGPGPDPGADPLEAVRPRLDLIRGRVQGMAQEVREILSLRRSAVVAGPHHNSCSRAARRADMPRAV
jgi:hypothetical protein